MKWLGQKGDTIVEVLLALAVVSAMLAGAYVTSNRSLQNSRQSQERSEALKIAERQLEGLKSVVNAEGNEPFTINDVFCMTPSNTVGTATNPARTFGSMPSVENDDFTDYVADCIITNGVPYHTSIVRTGTNFFTVNVRWDRAGGGGQEQVELVYRLHR